MSKSHNLLVDNTAYVGRYGDIEGLGSRVL